MLSLRPETSIALVRRRRRKLFAAPGRAKPPSETFLDFGVEIRPLRFYDLRRATTATAGAMRRNCRVGQCR